MNKVRDDGAAVANIRVYLIGVFFDYSGRSSLLFDFPGHNTIVKVLSKGCADLIPSRY